MGASCIPAKVREKTPTSFQRLSGYAYNFQNTTKHPPDFFFDFRLGHTPTKIPILTITTNTDIDLFTNEVHYLLMKFTIKRNLQMAHI